MTPRAEILVDGRAVASTFYSVLKSVTVTDELGVESDTVEIVLDEGQGELELPPAGALIEVRLGFVETGLVHMGTFARDAAGGSGPADELTLSGTAIDLGSRARQPETRAWEDVTLSDIVETLAAEANLRPTVAAELAGACFAYEVQRGESALNFLTRLARPLDAVAKAADGRLVISKLGSGTDAAGAPIAPIDVRRTDLTGWTWSEEEREKYGRVKARWRDIDTGVEEEIEAGEAEPVRTLRKVYGSRIECERAVRAALDQARRGDLRIDGDGRFRPEMFAGGAVRYLGLRSNLDGEAQITSVTHALGGALTTAHSATKSAA
jgi:phage protein D